jgi:hypothetical protein
VVKPGIAVSNAIGMDFFSTVPLFWFLECDAIRMPQR